MSPVVVLLIAACVVAVGMLLLDRGGKARRAAKAGEPVCGACGYRVVGLESLACPECGGDLRRVGIGVPGAPPGTSPIVVVLAVVILAGWSGIAFFRATSNMLPGRVGFERRTQFRQPASGAYAGADVTTTASAWTGGALRAGSRVQLLPSAGGTPAVALDVDVQTGGYEYRAAGGRLVRRSGGVDAPAVLQWMKDAGVDTTDPSVQTEAAAIATEMRSGVLLRPRLEAARHAERRSSGTSSGMGSGFASRSFQERIGPSDPGVLRLAAICVVAIPWLGATVFLIARLWPRRRPHASAAATT